MKKWILFGVIVLLTFFNCTNTQNKNVIIPEDLNFKIPENLQKDIYKSLNTLFEDIDSKGTSLLIDKENSGITLELFKFLKTIEYRSIKPIKVLAKASKVSKKRYLLEITYMKSDSKGNSITNAICSLIAIKRSDKIFFSSPIGFHTADWKNQIIGKINYHYKEKFNQNVAEKFNTNNSKISTKLGLKTENLFFYKCSDYQEVLRIMGVSYSSKPNEDTQSSTIINNTIISGLNSEDFSHDIFHFYSSKLFKSENRNWTTEEGLAYSWGNAYYTKNENEMITRDELVFHLKKYLDENQDEDFLTLFFKNPRIFKTLSSKVSLKSTISSLLCDEVEDEKGIDGIKVLINCGKGDDNFFKTLDELIGINKDNFNTKIKKILERY